MKRIFSILLIMALLVVVMPMTDNAALAEEFAAVTSTNGYGVRMREGPSKAYRVTDKFSVGTTVTVLQHGEDWSQIQVGQSVGWMMNQFLNFGSKGDSSSGGSSGTNATTNATVISDNGLRVWLRATAGGKRLFLNAAGTGVNVLERGNTWSKVSINGTVGYMMTKYLSLGTKPAPVTKVTGVSINYPAPVVLDTLEAKVIPEDATVKYEWLVGDKGDASSFKVMGTDATFYVKTDYAGKIIQVKVTGTGSFTGSATSKTTDAVQISKGLQSVALSNAKPVVGDQLSAAIKPSSATVEYSWRVGGIEVSNEATYTVAEGDIGKLIQLKVSGISGYVGTLVCTADAEVLSSHTIRSVKLSTNYPVVGATMKATIVPEGATVKMAWYTDGELVSKDATYKVSDMDLGKKITLVVTGTGSYTGSVTVSVGSAVASASVKSVKITNTDPMVGDKLRATVEPADATVEYVWYVGSEKEPSGTGATYTVQSADKEKQIKVVATGAGIFNGTASATTKAVADNKVITAVAMSNNSPVVGNEITAVVTPKNAEADKLTYNWYVDNVRIGDAHSATYTVRDTDVGKKLRVEVVGANGYTGDVYSVYSNPVVNTMDVKSVAIRNTTKGNYATSATPEVGDELKAEVSPAQATVEYTWMVGSDICGTGSTYTIKGRDKGKQIKLLAKGTEHYKKEVSATTKTVVKLKPIDLKLTVVAPKAGVKPSFAVSGVGKTATVSMVWVDEKGDIATLEANGTFKPGVVYKAQLTITPAEGYTLNDAIIKVNDKAAEKGMKNTYLMTFDATGSITVTDSYLSGLDKAAVIAGEKLATVSNTQVTGEVEWDWSGATPGELHTTRTATIKLTAKDSYELSGLPDSFFKVDGADKVIYAGGSDTVRATWNIPHELTIKLDKEEALMDGSHDCIISCIAYLSNFEGKFEPEEITWEIASSKVEGTKIDAKTGKLVVGRSEPTGHSLIVRVTVKKDEFTKTSTVEIPVVSGTDETALVITFTKCPQTLVRGETGYYEAMISNSTEGYDLFAAVNGKDPVHLDDQILNTGDKNVVPEDCKTVRVYAVSRQDKSISCSVMVDITDPSEPEKEEEVPIFHALEGFLIVEQPEEATAEPETEKAEEATAEPETDKAEETTAKPKTEKLEEAVEAPTTEKLEEAIEAPTTEQPEETTEEPATEQPEETTEEPTTEQPEEAAEEPAVEQPEETTEEPATEQPEETTEEPATEQPEEATEEPATEQPEETTEEPAAEQPEEPLTEMVISIKDTVTGEVIEQVTTDEQPEEKEEAPKAAKTSTKTAGKNDANVEEPDEALDALEGDDIGKSVPNEKGISIAFAADSAKEVKCGATVAFKVNVDGSDKGVKWVVRRSKNAEGKVVSTISQDGVLTVAKDETADKLIVIAISEEDNEVRTRWVVAVTKASSTKTSTPATEEVIIAPETSEQEIVAEKPAEAKEEPAAEEIKPENTTLTPEMIEMMNKELEQTYNATQAYEGF